MANLKKQKKMAKHLYATHMPNFYYWLESVKKYKDSYSSKIVSSVTKKTNLSERAKVLFEEFQKFTHDMLELVFDETKSTQYKLWLVENQKKADVYGESMIHGAKFPLSPSSGKSRPNIVKRAFFFFHKYQSVLEMETQEQIETITTETITVDSEDGVPNVSQIIDAVVTNTVAPTTEELAPTTDDIATREDKPTHIHFNGDKLYALHKDDSLPFDSFNVLDTITDKQKIICFLLSHTKDQYDDIIEYLLTEIKIPRL